MSNAAKIVISAEDRAQAAFASVRRGLGSIADGAGLAESAIAGITAALSVGAMATAVRGAANYADEMGKLAQRAGVTAEAYSGLAYAAKLADVDNELLSKGLRRIALDAADGGEKLRALGISLKDAGGSSKSADRLLLDVAERFEKMPDGIQKTALLVDLFGEKIGPQLAPLLNAGRDGISEMADEARRMGLIVDTEAAVAAERFNDNLTRLQSGVQGIVQQLAGPLIDGLGQSSAYFIKVANDVGVARAALIGFGAAVARTLGADEIGSLQTQARANQNAIALTVKQLEFYQKFADRGDAAAKDRAAQLRDQYTRLQADGQRISAQLIGAAQKIDDEYKPAKGSKLDDFAGGAGRGKAGADPRFAGLSYDEEITRRVGALLEGSALIKAREYEDTLVKLDNLYFSGAINGDLYASAIEKLARTSAAAGKEVEGLTDEQKRLADLLAKTESAGIERQRADMELLTKALAAGTITEQQYTEAVAARLGVVAEKTREAEDGAKRLADAYASTFDSAFQRGMKFGDLLKKLAFDTLNIRFLTPAAQSAGNWLGGMVSKAFSPGGLLSFDGGGYTGSGSRTGGLDGRGGFLAMVHPNERVTDLTRAGAPGATGGLVLQQTVTIDARGADAGVEARIRAAMAQNKAETLAAVAGMANRGGSFARALGRA